MESHLAGNVYSFMISAVVLAAPPLVVATVVGFIIAIFQGVTSIQDQTLPQTAKIIVIFAMLFLMSPLLAAPLFFESQRVFDTFSQIVK